MSWLFFAVLAYFIAAVVSVIDKVILTSVIPKPLTYAAWVGIFGIYGLVLVPFGFQLSPLIQNPELLFLSLASGFVFVIGLYFLFSAASINEVSRVVPVFGALVAVFTLVLGGLFLVERLDTIQLFAFLLLLLGSIIISFKFQDVKALSLKSLNFILVGALLFAGSFVLIKIVFNQTTFLNGFVMGRIGEVLAGLLLFGLQRREAQYKATGYFWVLSKKTTSLFILNKSLAGVFFLLQNYAIFLGSVSLVQAMSGIQYAFLLVLAVILSSRFPSLLEEKFYLKSVLIKAAAIIIIISGIFILALREKPADLAPGLRDFGVTFSLFRAQELGLDWQRVYLDILDDLGVKKIRIPAYWTDIEESPGQPSFFNLDYQIAEAERRDAKVILVLGQRLPRWPECHIPEWAKSLPSEERQEKLLKIIELLVNRYKLSSSIEYWQVENEPFLPGFGECPSLDKKFLDKELALVQSLDSRPVIVSASGELDSWILSARRTDILGTTMYRIIYNPMIPGGYFKYPLPPSFFHLKANLIKLFTKTKDIIVVELQAEPWGPRITSEMTIAEKDKSLSFEQFQENIEYAREVGFRSAYLWGVEWWLWEKENSRPEFWNYAKTLFRR